MPPIQVFTNLKRVVAKTANYTAVGGDLVMADASGGSFTVTLPASPNTDDVIGVKAKTVGSGTNTVTIGRNSKNIEGAAADVILYVANDYLELWYDGTEWWIVSDKRKPHACFFHRATGQTIPNITETKITSLTYATDIGKMSDGSNDRIVIRRAGIYMARASSQFIGIDDGEYSQVLIFKNGARALNNFVYAPATISPFVINVGVLELAVSDYIELYLAHNEGASWDTTTNADLRPQLSLVEMR